MPRSTESRSDLTRVIMSPVRLYLRRLVGDGPKWCITSSPEDEVEGTIDPIFSPVAITAIFISTPITMKQEKKA